MDNDPTLKAWFEAALNMSNSASRKRSRSVANLCDKFSYAPFLKRIAISKDKEQYLQLTAKFEAAVKDVLDGKCDAKVAAEHYELDYQTLYEEIHRYRNSMAEEYEYNGTGKIFSFKEALTLLEMLATVPQSHCMCQICTLDRLPILAYHVARMKKKPYPYEWDKNQQAGQEWLTNFEIFYEYEIMNSFPIKCVNPARPGTSRDAN